MKTQRLGFKSVWQCKKCHNRGDFWWALFHRHRQEWHEAHPGASEHWRPR